jgi:hypothetical protein
MIVKIEWCAALICSSDQMIVATLSDYFSSS